MYSKADGWLSSCVLAGVISVSITCKEAWPRSAEFAITGGYGLVETNCRNGATIEITGPIPAERNEVIRDGQAVAIIIESAKLEPEILAGRVIEQSGQMRFAVTLNAGLASRLASDEPIRITRRYQAYVVLSREAAWRSVLSACLPSRDSRGPAAAAPAPFVISKARLGVSGDSWWVVLAARSDPNEALTFADEYKSKFTTIQVVQATNGVFVVVFGPERLRDPQNYKERLIASGRVPSDTYLSRGERFVARVQRKQ